MLSAPKQRKLNTARSLRKVLNTQIIVLPGSNSHDLRPAQRPQGVDINIISIQDDVTSARDDAREVQKCPLYVCQITKNIRMVELEIVNDRDMWSVVDKFAPLVEKRAVVFIALDHKRIVGCAEVVPHRWIERHSADQKTWIAARRAQQIGGERSRRRLTVCARDDDIPPSF